MATTPYAELHAHTNFSFLDGASAPDELVERAVELGLTGLAVTDHNGLYGAVRFMGAAEEAGLHRSSAMEIELLDPAVARSGSASSSRPASAGDGGRRGRRSAAEPEPARRGPARPGRGRRGRGCPVTASRSRRTTAASASGQRGPHLVLLARDAGRLAEPVPAHLAREPRRDEGGARASATTLLAEHTRGSSRCRAVATARSRGGCGSAIARRAGRGGALAGIFGRGDGPSTSGFFIELSHHLLPDDDWLVAESAALADELGLPVVVTNDVHYATAEGASSTTS